MGAPARSVADAVPRGLFQDGGLNAEDGGGMVMMGLVSSLPDLVLSPDPTPEYLSRG